MRDAPKTQREHQREREREIERDGEGWRGMERDGEGWRGGKEVLIFLEASSAPISREQGPNKLSPTPTLLVRGQWYGGHRYQVLRKPHVSSSDKCILLLI
jgi:hypothetical protein